MFISTAYAQSAGAPAGGGLLEMFLPLVLIFVIFYFLLIRPQQKKQKEHTAKLNAVRRNDRVIMGGGMYGRVTKDLDDEIMVEIAPGVEVKVLKAALMDVISKEAAKEKDKEAAKKAKAKKDEEKAEDDADASDETADADDNAEEKNPANDSGEKKGGLGGLFGKK